MSVSVAEKPDLSSGAAAATVYAAKVHRTRTALDITGAIFDLMGARATSGRYGFDRFWRNVRTHTLHDPVAYKAREVGNFALNGRITPDPLYT
jgi:alkylation response protein AidB-like acyl-CoA dehydrogenase